MEEYKEKKIFNNFLAKKGLRVTRQRQLILDIFLKNKGHLGTEELYEIVKAKDNNAVKQIGIDWCTQQSKGLIEYGVPAIHYYTIGKSDNIKQIAKVVF